MNTPKTTRLTPEAAALVQQAAGAMCKALEVLELANGRPLTVADLHRLNGPALRAATFIKRANSATNNTTA